MQKPAIPPIFQQPSRMTPLPKPSVTPKKATIATADESKQQEILTEFKVKEDAMFRAKLDIKEQQNEKVAIQIETRKERLAADRIKQKGDGIIDRCAGNFQIHANSLVEVLQGLSEKLKWTSFIEPSSDKTTLTRCCLNIDPKNDFWKLAITGYPLSPDARMNCQESVLLALLLAKKIPLSEINAIFQNYQAQEDEKPLYIVQEYDRLLHINESQFTEEFLAAHDGAFKPGDIIFFGGKKDSFKGSDHVAVCLDASDPRNPLLLSLWMIPKNGFSKIKLSDLLQEVKTAKTDIGLVTERKLKRIPGFPEEAAAQTISILKDQLLIDAQLNPLIRDPSAAVVSELLANLRGVLPQAAQPFAEAILSLIFASESEQAASTSITEMSTDIRDLSVYRP